MNEELLRDLEAAPDRLAAELEELSEGELVKRLPDGGWNLKELAGHMRDVEHAVGIERISMLLEQDNPTVPVFDPDEAARKSNAGIRPIGELLAEWNNYMEQTVAMVRGLDDAMVSSPGVHAELGEITALRQAKLLRRHDEQRQRPALELKGLSREPRS